MSAATTNVVDQAGPDGSCPRPPGWQAVVLCSYVIMAGTTSVIGGGGPPRGAFQLRWEVVLSDLFLAAVAVSQLRGLGSLLKGPARHRCAGAAFLLGIALLPALALHPSARGGAAVLRWLGVAFVALAIGRLDKADRGLVLGTFAGVTGFQVALAVAQWANGGPVGIGDADANLLGGVYASSGLLTHPYVLAAWCSLGGAVLLAAAGLRGGRWPWPAVAAAPFLGVGLAMSRAGVLAAGIVVVTFAMAAVSRRRLRPVVALAVAALALGGVMNLAGWLDRSAVDSGAGLTGVTNRRDELFDQAWGLLARDPIFGVGPGRYVEALVSRPDLVALATEPGSRPVHVVPYLVLVEGGVIVLPALLLLAVAVIGRARQGGVTAVGVALSLTPFLFLDHLNWSYPQGLMLVAVWLGCLDQLGNIRGATGMGQAAGR